MNTHRIITADCIEGMKTLADGSVHTCITSPPYFGLRNYNGGTQEIGCEQSPEDYVQKMVEVFRGVKRILRDDGTLWLNLGDSYASNGCYINAWLEKDHNKDKKHLHTNNHERYEDRKAFRGGEYGIKAKDLIGIPWRVALALQADGWYLRQDIIWHKPNPMPESVEDRCTKAHEYIFLLTKSQKYYYDKDAISEPLAYPNEKRRPIGSKGAWQIDGRERGENGGGKPYEGYPTRKNKRSVWSVSVKPFRDAHFATFPPDLIKPCILAGTSEHGCCSNCGSPYKRILEKTGEFQRRWSTNNADASPYKKQGSMQNTYKTSGWEATCSCDGSVVPCTVFDPFTGAGTTCVVSLNHGRNFIGTELNPDYVKIAENRIAKEVKQTLASVME